MTYPPREKPGLGTNAAVRQVDQLFQLPGGGRLTPGLGPHLHHFWQCLLHPTTASYLDVVLTRLET